MKQQEKREAELSSMVLTLRAEIQKLKSENFMLSHDRRTLTAVLSKKDKKIQGLELELRENNCKIDNLAEIKNEIISGFCHEIPGILEKMPGESHAEKEKALASKTRDILRINRKGSLSCTIRDQFEKGRTLRVGFSIGGNGEYIAISARCPESISPFRNVSNAIESCIGYLSLRNGDVIIHFYENPAPSTNVSAATAFRAFKLGNTEPENAVT